jgi:putative membrane protein
MAAERPVPNAVPPRNGPLVRGLAAVTVLALVASGIAPYDRATWWMEVAPVLVGLPLLVATRRRFPLTTMAYVLLTVHAVILVVGGRYTYARVPLGDWARDAFGLARNPYDRLGHLAQGFVPAIVARELLLRTTPLRRGGWLFTLVSALCLAVSAVYELLEWATAVVAGGGAVEFLGTQGDVWDAQADMACAWIGATVALWTLARAHDRQLRALGVP